MNTELERRLRDDMDLFTRGLQVPAGLAAEAYRHGRRRQRAARGRALTAAGLTIALAGGAAAVAVASGGPQPVTVPRTETVAYVIPQVQRALSAVEVNNLVLYLRQSGGTPVTYQPAPDYPATLGSSTGAPSGRGYEISVLYRGNWLFSPFTHDGQRLYSELVATGKGSATSTAVIYSSRTWWRTTTPPPTYPAVRTGCVTYGGADYNAWIAQIKAGLSCGTFKLTGTQVVDEVNAIKITEVSRDPSGEQLTLWVDPRTYLPVRIAYSDGTVIDYRFLPPTSANRALVDLPIPAGFQQVAPPTFIP